MIWDSAKKAKQERLHDVSDIADGKLIPSEQITTFLETVIHCGDKVVLEGCNQKQAAFLAYALAQADPAKINHLTMIIPSVSREEHLDLFEKNIAETLNFAFAGVQSKRLAEMQAADKLKIGAIHTYLELYSRLFVDLTPQICLVAADKADRNGNLFTGFSTEDTPTLVEATAFKDGIVIVQANEIVDSIEKLPRVDIPGSWVDFVVKADKASPLEPLFTRDPQKIKNEHILMGMMTIKGIYARHDVKLLNHGIGYNGAAIELLLPTYGEELGLKGKICTHWLLNPHPTLIPAIESGWVKQVYSPGGEIGMERYTAARPDIFFIGPDGNLRANRTLAQITGLYGIDLFLGGTLQMDYNANSTTVTNGRLSGYGGAPNMGNATSGRRHTTKPWCEMAPGGDSYISGKKLVVQMLKSSSAFGPGFVPELDAVEIGRKAGMKETPVMIYGEDVTHVVTEQGIAYLYTSEDPSVRTKLLGSIAQGTPIGEKVSAEEIKRFRDNGMVALPEDLSISPAEATKDKLAAKSLQEIQEWSGGLYDIPQKFQGGKV